MSDVLVVTAHPDDVDYGAAGAVARWVREGLSVGYCIVTRGEAGAGPAELDSAGIARLRRSEQIEAARVLGVEQVSFLGHPDGQVVASLELRRDIARVIREQRPSRVVTHLPSRQLRRIRTSHPDHMAVGEATLCAVYPDARTPRSFPELVASGLPPHTAEEVWLMAGRDSTHWVDITTTMDVKVDAVLCHASQHDDEQEITDNLRRWAATIAARAPQHCGKYAESFMVVSTR